MRSVLNYNNFFISSALAATILMFASTELRSAIVVTEDKPTWVAGIGGNGNITHMEDFEGFMVDTPFRIADGPVSLGGGSMSLVEIGPGTNPFNNFVDVLPYPDPGGNSPNGSNFALMNVNLFALNTTEVLDDIEVKLAFTQPVSAWGGSFRGFDGVEQGVIDVFLMSGGAPIATLDITMNTPTFLGFYATAGETVEELIFRSSVLTSANESFGMDDLMLVAAPVPIPEPGTYALLGVMLAVAFHAKVRTGAVEKS